MCRLDARFLAGSPGGGSRYLRMLFVQAAKVIMMRPNRWPCFSFGAWLTDVGARMPDNKVAITLANNPARTIWSILHHATRCHTINDRDMAADAS